MSSKIIKGTNILEAPDDYCVVDIETTGLSAKKSEIIEISSLKVRNGKVVDSFSKLVRPEEFPDRFIVELTGITWDMLYKEEKIDKVITDFKDYLGKDVILGYNITFDVRFLCEYYKKCTGKELENNYFDVLSLARKKLNNLNSHKQTVVAKYLGIDIEGVHRALKDCSICYEIYNRLK